MRIATPLLLDPCPRLLSALGEERYRSVQEPPVLATALDELLATKGLAELAWLCVEPDEDEPALEGLAAVEPASELATWVELDWACLAKASTRPSVPTEASRAAAKVVRAVLAIARSRTMMVWALRGGGVRDMVELLVCCT
jgi:hypothetical protein